MWSPAYSQSILEEGWRRLDLRLLKKPIQRRIEKAWIDSNAKIFVVHVGRQIGKSHLALLIAIEQCLKNPNYRVVFVSHVEERLIEYFTALVTKCLETCPTDLAPVFVKNSLRFKNKSVILLASDANKSFFSQRGQRYNLVILDEYSFYHNPKALLWTALYPTTTTTRGKILIITTSPETPAHYSNELFARAHVEGWYFKGTIHEDETFTKEEIQELRLGCLDQFSWDINYECTLGVADRTKLIIPEFTEQSVQAVPSTDLFRFYKNHSAMDLGVRDKTVCLFAKYLYRESIIYVQDELQMQGKDMTTVLLASEIKKKELEVWVDEEAWRRVCDTDNPLLRQDLASLHQLPFIPVDKEHLHEMVDKVRTWFKAGRIVINPKCKLLIETLKGGLWKDDKKKEFGRTEALGHCDALAALIYLVQMIDEVTDPIPPHYNLDLHNTFMGKQEAQVEAKKFANQLFNLNNFNNQEDF